MIWCMNMKEAQKLILKILVKDEKLLPIYDHDDDAALNLYASETIEIPPGEHKAIPTGIHSEIPFGYAALIWDRSSMAHKQDCTIIGGVIDAGYRGEWKVLLHNLGKTTLRIDQYQKFAQAIIQKIEHPVITRVQSLNDTPRGEHGFGSTGKF